MNVNFNSSTWITRWWTNPTSVSRNLTNLFIWSFLWI